MARVSIGLFTLKLKQNELVEEEEEEEEAGEEVGFLQGLSRAEIARYVVIWKYIFRYIGTVYHCLDYFLFLWLGQQVITEDDEAKALVGTVNASGVLFSSW